LLTEDGKRFYWPAIAGDWKPHVGGGTPRDFGPCGDVLDRNAPLLFTHWERRYAYLLTATPLAEEGLLVPFYIRGKAIGTVWAIAHDERRKFDVEDLRQLESLARFASAAYQALQLQNAEDLRRDAVIRLDSARKSQNALEKVNESLRQSEQHCRVLLGDLRESETRKSAIMASALDGIITMDEEGRITDFNPAAEQLLGFRHEEIIGQALAETIIPERFRDAHRRGLIRFVESGESSVIGRRLELPVLRRDGTEVEAEIAVSASRLENGRIVFSGYVRDLTERRKSERAAQQLASIIESSNDAIVSKDLDGIITTWNRGAERIFGYRTEEVIGKPITIIIPPDRLEEEPRILAKIRAGERIDHFETVRRHKDGRLIDISLTVSPMRDRKGQIVGASKIARDITDRKQADERVKASERYLQELLAAIPAAIYTTDADGKITFYNEAAVELSGRRPEIGRDAWCVGWKLYRPDGSPLPLDECPMAIALNERKPIRGAEVVVERPDGTRVPVIPYPTPIRDAQGNIIGAINMLADISERKQAETQQRVLLNELNHRVKNNMQMLQALLDLAAKRTNSKEAKQVLQDASRRISAMAAAQRVLYGSSGGTCFNVAEFLAAVCQTVGPAFPAQIEISCDATGMLPNDVSMPLALILNELLTNAVKHGLNGGEGKIRLGLQQNGGCYIIFVEDDGPGFELASVRKRSSGLRLVEALARQLQARLEVTRNPSRCSLEFS
jgi:PAS domain S-box-containing protein